MDVNAIRLGQPQRLEHSDRPIAAAIVDKADGDAGMRAQEGGEIADRQPVFLVEAGND